MGASFSLDRLYDGTDREYVCFLRAAKTMMRARAEEANRQSGG
jgi:hypothetical protein